MPPLLVGQAGAAQQVRRAQHRVHRRAQFVAHAGEEVGLGLAGGLGLTLQQLRPGAGGADGVDRPLLPEPDDGHVADQHYGADGHGQPLAQPRGAEGERRNENQIGDDRRRAGPEQRPGAQRRDDQLNQHAAQVEGRRGDPEVAGLGPQMPGRKACDDIGQNRECIEPHPVAMVAVLRNSGQDDLQQGVADPPDRRDRPAGHAPEQAANDGGYADANEGRPGAQRDGRAEIDVIILLRHRSFGSP
jgi:hypothetical protein